MNWLTRLFSSKPEREEPSRPYLMLILFYEGSVYFGGYTDHPISQKKDSPMVIEYPVLTSIEKIYSEVFSIVERWVSVRPESVHLSKKIYPMQPLSNSTLSVVVAILPDEPRAEGLVKFSLSNLAIMGETDWLTSIVQAELQVTPEVHS